VISIKKPGYLDKTANLTYTVTQTETINLHELIDMGIGKIEVGGNLADMIDINPIYFDLGKYIIRPDAALELDKIVGIMNKYPDMVVELGSHTDCRSSKAFNQKLSQNRAKASADYIKSRITTPSRISGVGYGESKLKINCPCEGTVKSSCPEEEHAKNRRTEFIIKKVN
jgi:outer membrane protein OmpA-like peptidoglycan-associated protein